MGGCIVIIYFTGRHWLLLPPNKLQSSQDLLSVMLKDANNANHGMKPQANMLEGCHARVVPVSAMHTMHATLKVASNDQRHSMNHCAR